MKKVTKTLISGLIFAALTSSAYADNNIKIENMHTRSGDFAFETSVLNGIPTEESSKKLFNLMDFQRATQAYIGLFR